MLFTSPSIQETSCL